MKCLHTFLVVLAVAAAMVLPWACADDFYNNSPDEALKLSVDTILVNHNEQSVTIGVTARDEGWTLAGVEPWCSVTPASGERGITRVTVNFASNIPETDSDATNRTATLTFSSGGVQKKVSIRQLNTDNIPLPHEHADASANKQISPEIEEWYYNSEPKDTPPDHNQTYRDFYFNYLSHLKLNEGWDGGTWATGNDRFLYSYIERNPAGTAENTDGIAPTPKLNYGMEFEMVDYNGTFAARVLYVEQNSPAARAGLKRGDWFWEVDGTRLGNWESTSVSGFRYHYQRFIDTLVHPVAGKQSRLGMLTFRTAGGGQLIDERREVTITPALHLNNPILGAPQVIEELTLPTLGADTTYTGYLMYNNFDPRWRDQLVTTFRSYFANRPEGKELQNFILDLRYNKHGTVEMAQLMGNLLVGNVTGSTEDGEYAVAGKTFANYTFNNSARNRTVNFETHPDGIAPKTVFILTSKHTAGAAELLINALRGLDQSVVNLVVVGEVTQGLAAGMVKRTVVDPIDSSREYSAWIVSFRCTNGRKEGEYIWGLVPNSEVNELERGDNMKWSATWEWKGANGSTEDPLIKRAVDIIKGRQLMPTGVVGISAKRSRTGYPREFCFPTNMTMSTDN